jgi:hypothetical protein
MVADSRERSVGNNWMADKNDTRERNTLMSALQCIALHHITHFNASRHVTLQCVCYLLSESLRST